MTKKRNNGNNKKYFIYYLLFKAVPALSKKEIFMKDIYEKNQRLSHLLSDYWDYYIYMEQIAFVISKEIQTFYDHSLEKFYDDIRHSEDYHSLEKELHKYVDTVFHNIEREGESYYEWSNPLYGFDNVYKD